MRIYPNPYNYHHNKVIDPRFRESTDSLLEEGSYFKLNTVSLSYRFPKRWLDFSGKRGYVESFGQQYLDILQLFRYQSQSVNGLGRDTSSWLSNSRTWTMGVVLSL